jgi:hypothetical protein
MATPSSPKNKASKSPSSAKVAASKSPRASAPTASASVACAGFQWSGGFGGVTKPVWMSPGGGDGRTMIDFQKGRNNYYSMPVQTQVSMCRRMSERNWFLRPVVETRHASYCEDFDALNQVGESMSNQYAFGPLVADIMHEVLVSSNVVCMWRKGQKLPNITVMDAEKVDYKASGGLERIKVSYAQDQEMAKDKNRESEYRKLLGDKMYEAMTKGKPLEIIKGMDEEWDFETLIGGKRRGVFCIPEMVSILDCVDYAELMGIGDWNLAWARKDVIRGIKKGYPVTHGQGAGVNSVDITDLEIAALGEGFGEKVNGNAVVPMNHDVNPFYLTMDGANFDPKIMESAWDRLLHYGGIEAVVLFGSFSQQNGAAPSLMRNHRTRTFKLRRDVEGLLRRIFLAKEFNSLDWGGGDAPPSFFWGVKSLYSMDELLSLSKGTADGVVSPQTRRAWLGLNDRIEGDRMEAAHAARTRYAPPFEAGQALLPAMFDDLATADAVPAPPAEPGRPADVKG